MTGRESFDGKNNILKIDERTTFHMTLCETLPEKLQCAICHLLMQNPLQTCRGELACENCYKEAIRYNRGICPIDGEPIEPNEYYYDKFVDNQIQKLKCFCSNKVFGCPWRGKISEFEVHSLRCEYKTVNCCLCDVEVLQSTFNSHLQHCPKLSLNGKCIYHGCTFKPVNVDDLEKHLKNDVINHALLSAFVIRNMQTTFKLQYDMLQKKASEDQERLERQMKKLTDQFALFVKNTKEINIENERKHYDLQKRVNELEKRAVVPIKDHGNNELLKDVSDKIYKIQQNLSGLDLRQQLSENTSYDSKLIWKVDKLSSRMERAEQGKVVALHSAPTFTSKYGYKFCGRLYLNGDGAGEGTHVSMYFILMKSEYDNLLQWPFNKRINMHLISQDEAEKDVVEWFVADTSSPSYAKPTKDMNIAVGCPLFVKKEILLSGGFVKDDAIFIELSVHDI